MSKNRIGRVVFEVFSRWWLLAPLLSLVGAIMAWSRDPAGSDLSWARIGVGALWGLGLGILVVPLSMPRSKKKLALALSAVMVGLVLASTGVILGWSPAATAVAAVAGAVFGLLARWWAPYVTLV